MVSSYSEGTDLREIEDSTKSHKCTLKSIEGSEILDKDQRQSAYITRMQLNCRNGVPIKITCYKPSNGDALEMTLGEFERIFSKLFRFGNLILETPLRSNRTGFPIQEPVTPAQILQGKLQFKFKDKTPMSFEDFGEFSGKGYRLNLQDGASVPKRTNLGAYVSLTLKMPDNKELSIAPDSTAMNGADISSVEIGYSKQLAGVGPYQFRNTHLLVRGKKPVQGKNAEVTFYWSDPVHSHITYEGMWKAPGRQMIDNWYQN